jgi:glycosyltransferase involved in cell wall biosynthesis
VKASASASATPAVSVLLPVWNAAATLRAALLSVARQSLHDFECVIVDDGSEDASRDVAASFALADGRFRVLSQPHAGIVAALNAGLDLCRGRYVARMDADDLMHRERLRLQMDALQSDPDLAGVGCHVRFFPRRDLTDGLVTYEKWLNGLRTPEAVLRDRFIECPLAHPTWTIRREVLASAGYRDDGFPEDYDALLRITAKGTRLGVVARPLLLWRDGPARLSRIGAAYGADRFTACKAHHLAQSFLGESSEYVLWGYGDTGRVLARALAARGRRPTHIIELHPGRIGQRIFGAHVIGVEQLATVKGRKIVVSVAGPQARGEIRERLAATGFVELVEFVCAA